jgi:hypothetical protein
MNKLVLLGLLTQTASADMRSSVFAAIVARSGQVSNCSLFASMFTPDGVYESPVGSGWIIGPSAIEANCNVWNTLIGPQGNGWYPGALFSSESGNRTAFTLQIRTVSKGGCKTDIHGIVNVEYDIASDKIGRWFHFYDSVWDNRDLYGTCS